MERLVISQLSTVTGALSDGDDDGLHNRIELVLDLLYSGHLLEDAYTYVASGGGHHAAEISSLLHKLKTRISSLLSSKTAQARWVGVCLVKAGIETSPSFLQIVAVWMPMLLKLVVARPENVTNERAVAVLTRIFILTLSKPALTRELTSPHLPTFCQHLISQTLSRDDGTRLVALQSIRQILIYHPGTFRPYHQKALDLVRSILFSEDDKNYAFQIIQTAAFVYASLVKCSQSKSQGEEWVKLFKETISNIDQTCDILFESIIEEKDADKPPRQIPSSEVNHLLSPQRVGVKRVRILLGVLEALLSQPITCTPPPSIPLSPLISLLDRLFAVHLSTKPNPSAPPSTYHLLLSSYPTILQSALSLVVVLVLRISSYSPSLALQFLHPLAFSSATSKHHSPLRAQIYTTLSIILTQIGRSLSQKDVQPLIEIISAACDDIIPPPPPVIITKEPVTTPSSMLLTQPTGGSTYKKRKAPAPQNKANTPAASSMHADQFLKPTSSTNTTIQDSPILSAAKKLLTTVILNLQSTSIPSETRSRIERTIVLSAYTPGLLAAVLYPASKKRGASLLPHLIAVHSRDSHSTSQNADILLNMAIEGTLHPRLQVVKPMNQNLSDDRSSILSSPVEGRFWAGSPLQGTSSLDELISPSQPEADITMSADVPLDDAASYPEPPPAPVPQHAKLPASPKAKAVPLPPPSAPPATQSAPGQQQGGAMSPPSIPSTIPRNNGSNGGVASNGDRIFMPMPSPGRGVHAALPPSPLRQSMSIFEEDDSGKIVGREGKRVKIDDARSPLGMGVLNSGVGESDDEDEDDDGGDIPEIVMDSGEE
ncbi:hypothetical protein AA313_de0200212 [Arthrobotrys entomopaga]|nr:hypothetical protein AA313_de0200212 [Arthrobotrys entomopaga]